MLKYTISFPPLGASDVIERIIHTETNGTDSTDSVFVPTAPAFERTFADNDVVKIFIVDKDDAGNLSAPGVALEFTATDTIPPNPPGAPSVANVEEI